MAFCVAYNNICSKDIKYIYSTKEPKYRERRHYRNYNPKTIGEVLNLRKAPSDRRRLFQFDSTYGEYIPRAPAFRAVSPNHVSDIIERLSQPYSPRESKHRRRFREYTWEKPKPVNKLSKEEMRLIIERLSQPTVSSKAHQYQPRSMSYDDDLPSVSD